MPFSFSDTLTSPADGSNLGLSSRLDNIKIHVFIGYYSVWIIYIYIYTYANQNPSLSLRSGVNIIFCNLKKNLCLNLKYKLHFLHFYELCENNLYNVII